MTDQELATEILRLTLLCQQGNAGDEERARLEYLLADSDSARCIYNSVACDTVTLAEVADMNSCLIPQGHAELLTSETTTRFPSSRGSWQLLVALAALLFVAAGGITAYLGASRLGLSTQPRQSLGRIVHLDEVVWEAGATEFTEWAPVNTGDSLHLASGMVELVVNEAIQVVIQGPAEFELVSKQKAIAHSGKLVARVGEEGIGFEIETPHAQVFDQGTAFSISVSPESQTDVVVYEGSVDLAVLAAPKDSYRRLKTGEGMRVDQQGQFNRITSVESRDFLPPLQLGREAIKPSRLIASVSDNVASLATSKYYRIVGGGFTDDCVVYVDRLHQWNGLDKRGIPSFLRGADYVMTFNDDKVLDDLKIALELSQAASLYVMWDDRIATPAWLVKDFEDTGWDIGLDEGFNDRIPDVSRKTGVGPGESVDFVFSIWRREVLEPSTVVLGSIQQERITIEPREVSQSMYGVAVAPMNARNRETPPEQP